MLTYKHNTYYIYIFHYHCILLLLFIIIRMHIYTCMILCTSMKHMSILPCLFPLSYRAPLYVYTQVLWIGVVTFGRDGPRHGYSTVVAGLTVVILLFGPGVNSLTSTAWRAFMNFAGIHLCNMYTLTTIILCTCTPYRYTICILYIITLYICIRYICISHR